MHLVTCIVLALWNNDLIVGKFPAGTSLESSILRGKGHLLDHEIQ